MGRLEEGAPPNGSGRRQRRGGSPKTMLFEAVLGQGADKMCKTQGGKEIEGSNFFFFEKMMAQQFKKCLRRILARRKEIKDTEAEPIIKN